METLPTTTIFLVCEPKGPLSNIPIPNQFLPATGGSSCLPDLLIAESASVSHFMTLVSTAQARLDWQCLLHNCVKVVPA